MSLPVTQCWWIRHARIAQTGCYIGHTNLPATLPARVPASLIALPEGARWFSSPLARALETARWLIPRNSLLNIDSALCEQHFGVWEGKRYDEVWRVGCESVTLEAVKPEGGESFEEVCVRVRTWLDTMLAAHAGETLALVAHAGTIRAALGHALGLTPAQALAFHLDYASVSVVKYGDGARVDFINRLLWNEHAESKK